MNKYIEPNKKVKTLEIILCILISITFLFLLIFGLTKINKAVNNYEIKEKEILYRDYSLEDYSIDNRICEITYKTNESKLIISNTYEEYINNNIDYIEANKYLCDDGIVIYSLEELNKEEINIKHKEILTDEYKYIFDISLSLFVFMLALIVILFFSSKFNTYEKIWFISIMLLASIIGYLFPEESANGVSGIIIMLLYLLDTFFNILCELLISKQSKYNFLVSILVEITEILICLILMYRFATLAVTLLFWLPIDIISYINWSKHLDIDDSDLTIVRRLKGYQELLIILAMFIFTIVVGYFISGLDIKSDFLNNNKTLETIIIYLDALASACGIANGLFIFFRLQEQWYAWYICSIIETIINILSGQYVLLVLKLGYFSNTTYGYIKWKKYIDKQYTNSI